MHVPRVQEVRKNCCNYIVRGKHFKITEMYLNGLDLFCHAFVKVITLELSDKELQECVVMKCLSIVCQVSHSVRCTLDSSDDSHQMVIKCIAPILQA